MKTMEWSKFQSCFSLMQADKPDEVWAVSVIQQPELEKVQGISQQILDAALAMSSGWTGWGFRDNQMWLLFENRDDAVLASLSIGEGSNGQN
jgi:hypothetical protein